MKSKIYLVAFNEQTEGHYMDSWNAVLTKYPEYVKIENNVWLLQTCFDIDALNGAVRKTLDPSDSVLIVEVSASNARFLGTDSTVQAWYKKFHHLKRTEDPDISS